MSIEISYLDLSGSLHTLSINSNYTRSSPNASDINDALVALSPYIQGGVNKVTKVRTWITSTIKFDVSDMIQFI